MKKEEPAAIDQSVGAESKDPNTSNSERSNFPPEMAARMYSGASFVGVGHTGTYTVPENIRDEYLE